MRLKLLSDFYYNILKSSFIKNSFILLVSQLIAKILPLISLLFAMKLYSTEDFGKFETGNKMSYGDFQRYLN